MLPPPMTCPTSTPRITTSWISRAICWRILGAMPYLPSPISASPLSLRRMRLNRGGLDEGAVTGRGSYLAGGGWSRRSALKAQVKRHCLLDCSQIPCGEDPDATSEPLLRCRRDLIRHRFRGASVDFDPRLTRVQLGSLTRDRHDHHAVEDRIRGIVAEDDGWTRLPDFAALRPIERHPPDLTPADLHRRSTPPSSLRHPPRDRGRAPSRDSPGRSRRPRPCSVR